MAAPSGPDYFSFLGLPRKLGIDMNDLEQRYRALSRQFHPDYFYNASPGERRASLERSSYLNDAYRTLKSPAARLEYLLKLEGNGGTGAGASASDRSEVGRRVSAAPPLGLLEEVFALNEELDDIRALRGRGAAADQWTTRLELARRPIEAKRTEHESQLAALSSRWDAAVDAAAPEGDRREILDALRERFLERNYISNLLAGIEKELSE
ncbi:MAG TPA: Fe-S protein assembly co-chaperone HscB [Vicinamibacterales bacterium]|nr:Fe-S protein assembly co-chaperone HscB [Vicinamibacterales bacterium]